MEKQEIAKGLDDVVVDETQLSCVDGEKGLLVYRGYAIEELVNCSYEEICCLFINGDLPNRQQLQAMDEELKSYRQVPQPVLDFIAKAPVSDSPMATLRTATSMLSGFMPDIENLSPEKSRQHALMLTSQSATLAAAIGRARKGLPAVAPDMQLGHAANFLKMLTGEKPHDIVARTLDTALVLHADHGFNVSTFTARVVTSSLSDMVSAVTAALGSLKGPLHGGANTAVMEMLLDIGSPENVDAYVEQALAGKKKIMGFGHRVYKVLDPRAKPLKQMSKEWGERVGEVKWFKMSERIQELMYEKKKLNANVDFFSASTYYAMGIEPAMYTTIFAIARMIGWTVHVIEQLQDNRLMRPDAAYKGPFGKKYTPIEKR